MGRQCPAPVVRGPRAGQAYPVAPPQQLPGTAARVPARHGRKLKAAGSFPLAFPALPRPRASMPPVLLPASSQGRATAVVCMKVRFPQAALAAGCAPPRPRRILRSPCRPAAISDQCRRNLPKMGRKWPNLRLLVSRKHIGVRDFPDASEGGGGGGLRLQDPRRRPDASDCEKGQELGFEEEPH